MSPSSIASRSISSACAISSSASRLGVSLDAVSRRAAPAMASLSLIQARQALRLVLGDERTDQLVELAFQYLGQAVEGEVDAVIGHPALRVIVGADSLGTVAGADHRLARPRPLRGEPLALLLVEAGAEHLQGLGLVLVLRLLVLLDDDEAGGEVGDPDRAVGR